MYKREICKNWSETGVCRYGTKCQFAHGLDELSDNHVLYLSEQKQGQNDKYKSQNCRQFYRERFCPYGKRCHFRHEYRSFKKIHRHFYIAHLSATRFTHHDILAESKLAPDSVFEIESSSAGMTTAPSEDSFEVLKVGQKSGNSDLSTDNESEQGAPDDTINHLYSRRLPVFVALEEADINEKGSENFDREDPEEEITEASQSLLKLIGLEDDHDETAQATEGPYNGENWSQSAGDQLLLE